MTSAEALDKRRCEREPLDVRAETRVFFAVGKSIEGRQLYLGRDGAWGSLSCAGLILFRDEADTVAQHHNAIAGRLEITFTPAPIAPLKSAEIVQEHKSLES